MSGYTRRPSDHRLRRITASMQRLTAQLALNEALEDLREQIAELDSRCLFLATVRGARSAELRDATNTRNTLLVRADNLVQHWVENYADTSTVA